MRKEGGCAALRRIAFLTLQNDDQRVNRQRFDQREAKNHDDQHGSAGSWIASRRFGGGRSSPALAESAESARDGHTDRAANKFQFAGRDSRSAARSLGEHRNR